jgi:hypothetical protein
LQSEESWHLQRQHQQCPKWIESCLCLPQHCPTRILPKW